MLKTKLDVSGRMAAVAIGLDFTDGRSAAEVGTCTASSGWGPGFQLTGS